MKKTKILIINLIIILCFSLFSCGSAPNYPDNDTYFKFENYDYTNKDRGDKNWRDIKVDDGFKIDGVLDETAYSNLTPFELSDDKNEYKLSTKVHFGESGAYIVATMLDPNLYFLYGRPMHMNSSVIFTLDMVQAGKQLPSLSVKTVQMRVGVNGEVEQWMGREYGGYEFFKVFYPAMARTTVIDADSSIKQVNFLKNYSAKNVKGYNVEVFIPWSSFNLEEKPQYMLVRPEFNKVFDMSIEDSGGRINAGYRSHKDPEQFVPFDKNGPSNELFIPSYDSWKKGDDGVISQTSGGDKKMFIKDSLGNIVTASKYYLETEVSIVSNKDGDKYPKLGILAGQLNNNTYFYTIDALTDTNADKNFTSKLLLAVNCHKGTNDWKWPNIDGKASLGEVGNLPSYKNGGYARLAVMRDGAEWYFFAQDKLIATRKDIRGFDATTPSYFGLMTIGASVNFKNTSYAINDDAEVMLNKLRSTLAPPLKTQYKVGEEIDLSGGKVTRPGFDGFVKPIKTLYTKDKDSYNIRGFDTSSPGKKTVLLTIEGVEYSYEITVS